MKDLTLARPHARARWPVLVAPALVALSSPTPVAAQDRAVTIEKLMSAPFPSALTASPADGKVAWVQNAEGVRNIWVAEPPDYRGRQSTRYTKDDGQEIAGLTWTPRT